MLVWSPTFSNRLVKNVVSSFGYVAHKIDFALCYICLTNLFRPNLF
jgi:hypothetical protein